jgi:peroxiredoxin
MNRILLGLSVLTSGLVLGSQAWAVERAGDFALLDQHGRYHQLSYYDDHRAVVLLTQANSCEATNQALPAFAALESRFAAQGIEFLLLNPQGIDRGLVAAEMSSLGVALPVLMDDSQLVGELLGVDHAGEALILDPASFNILFRGPVGSELEQALSQVAAGQEVTVASLAADGCAISYAARDVHQQQGISYVADVAPIIAENCADCHRQNSIAPFALDSHQVVQGWSPMIKEVVLTKRMPPGQIDPHVGNIVDMSNLSDEEAQTLIHWIDSGSPRDGSADPLASLQWPDSKWLADGGNAPDIIVQIPPQEIPATGVVDYINVYADIPIEEDVWVRGSEIVPGDYSVLHHVITRVVQPEVANSAVRPEEGDDEFAGLENSEVPMAGLTGYVPGRRPQLEPGSGGLLRAGSRVAFQLHYTTSGREVTDHSELGIYLYPAGAVPEIEKTSGGRALNRRFLIPAGAKDHEVIESAVVEKDAYLVSFMPHMHYRGKRMKFVANYPDGTQEELLSVPNYQFNWQIRHHLEPKFVPAGTEIVAIGAFDNSTQNPFNPDPTEAIDWGPQSWDEMFIGYMRWQHVEDIK